MENHNNTWHEPLPSEEEINTAQIFNKVYIVEGFLLFWINFVLIMSVLKLRSTRNCKEYIIFCGKIFADGFYGLSYCVYGICGVIAYKTGYYRYHFDTWHCLFINFYNTMFIIAVPLTGLSITMVAFDRFLATIFPHFYYPLSTRYSWKMNLTFFLISMTGIPICYGYAISQMGIIHKSSYCSVNNAVWPEFWPYLRSFRIGGTTFGILLYIPIVVYLVNHSKNVGWWKLNGKMRSVTYTIGITTVVEFCLFLLPECCILFKIFPQLSEYFYFIMLSKGIVNIFVYTTRHRDIKKSVLLLFNLYKKSVTVVSTIKSETKKLNMRTTIK